MSDVTIRHVRSEWKFAPEGAGEFSGYGAVFDVLDIYRDIVLPGAFADALAAHAEAGSMPGMLWGHDKERPIGTWSVMREDERGLYVEGKLDLTSAHGSRAYAEMRAAGGCDMSIGYKALVYEKDLIAQTRKLRKVWLTEVSLARRGAAVNPEANVLEFKAADTVLTSEQLQAFLVAAGGFSREAAEQIAECGFKAKPNPRDTACNADILTAIARLTNLFTS